MKHISEGHKGFIAGLIEGEGCIAIARRKRRNLPNDNWYYEPVIIISNSKKAMLDFVASKYGGWINKLKKYKSLYHRKQQYNWKATGDTMRNLLKDILSYLITKRGQAKIILSFPNYRFGGRGRTDVELLAQEQEWAKMRVLNS